MKKRRHPIRNISIYQTENLERILNENAIRSSINDDGVKVIDVDAIFTRVEVVQVKTAKLFNWSINSKP